ncbi:hypothetical protein [Pedobacter steynii]
MNSEPKKKNEKPGSNFREEVSKVPAGNKAVKNLKIKTITKKRQTLETRLRKGKKVSNPCIQ